MKYISTTAICIAIVTSLLSTASAVRLESASDSLRIILAKKPYYVVKIEPKAITIKPGLSEIQKREMGSSNRVLTLNPAASVAVQPEQMSLGDLRILYQEAANKYGIDWRLIEAVHQIESGKSTSTCKTSYAGAMGPMQFLRSTFNHYSEGGNICDLRSSVFAAANLLSKSGASEGRIDDALFSYNHSSSYVAKVKRIMESI
jgi:membrane-bound lytic murein transglycosylase B